MSEQTPETEPATAQPTEQPATEQQPAEDPKPTETVDFWKRQARENEARAKSNAEAAKKWAEAEEAQKSEQQRQADAQARLERERDEARAEGVRYKAAAKHGVGEDYFDLLGSGDEDEVNARAERVGAFLKLSAEHEQVKAELEALKAGKPAPSVGRPTSALKPGATGEDVKPPEDHSYPANWLPSRQQ